MPGAAPAPQPLGWVRPTTQWRTQCARGERQAARDPMPQRYLMRPNCPCTLCYLQARLSLEVPPGPPEHDRVEAGKESNNRRIRSCGHGFVHRAPHWLQCRSRTAVPLWPGVLETWMAMNGTEAAAQQPPPCRNDLVNRARPPSSSPPLPHLSYLFVAPTAAPRTRRNPNLAWAGSVLCTVAGWKIRHVRGRHRVPLRLDHVCSNQHHWLSLISRGTAAALPLRALAPTADWL